VNVRPLVLQVIQEFWTSQRGYSDKAQGSHHPALDDPNRGWGKGTEEKWLEFERVGDHSGMEDGQAGPWRVPGEERTERRGERLR